MDQNSMAKDLLLYRGASSLDWYNIPVLAIIDRTSLRYRRLQRPCHGLVEADCRCYHRCPVVSTVIFLERVGSRATRTVLDIVRSQSFCCPDTGQRWREPKACLDTAFLLGLWLFVCAGVYCPSYGLSIVPFATLFSVGSRRVGQGRRNGRDLKDALA